MRYVALSKAQLINNMINENKLFRIPQLLDMFGTSDEAKILAGMPGEKIYTGTGRAALRIILDYLKDNGQLQDKNSQLLVPAWLCYSTLFIVRKVCFPVLTSNKNIKGVLVYHQYGFPQNMNEIMNIAAEKNWFVIEDCANVYESYYKGQRLGSFGVASIFAFSKVFSSLQGGALVSQNNELIAFAKKAVSSNDWGLSMIAHLSRFMTEGKQSPFWDKIQEMAYARIDSAKKISRLSINIIGKELQNNAMGVRKKNYQFLLDYFSSENFFDGLEREGVVPYVVPLIANQNQITKIREALLSSGVKTDIYHFDVNRNILNPKYVKCVWIPVHQGINEAGMTMICEKIKGALDGQ
jgi:dTDP-4-amino-4,6-dideoxygalactose transaminase